MTPTTHQSSPSIHALSLFLALPAVAAAGAPTVPLTIHEALVDDLAASSYTLVAGAERIAEPVTFGLPLPSSASVCAAAEVGLGGGATVGQFRVLSRWSDGGCGGMGSVQWLLVDTQASLPAHGMHSAYALTTGNGSFGGSPLASETATEITVDTGVATFTLRKQGYNLLHQVVVGPSTFLSPGSGGIELVATDGTSFRSDLDPTSDVIIEENGPARAVVRARGSYLSAVGMRALDYTVRMHFYRGHGRVRVVHTLRNASTALTDNRAFRSLELVLPTTLTNPDVRFATHGDAISLTLGSGQNAHLFQGENVYPALRDYDFNDFGPVGNEKWPSTIEGYTLAVDGGPPVATGDRQQPIDLFWAQASGTSDLTVTVGTRFAAGWWPQGLRVAGDGTTRVGLFPPENDRDYYARFTGHVTREVLLDFAPAAPDPTALLTRFQYPLTGKATDPEHYNRAGVLWERLVSFAGEQQLYDSSGYPASPFDYPLGWRPEVTRPLGLSALDLYGVVRHFYWGTGGGRNQYDQVKVDLHNYLRENTLDAGAWLTTGLRRQRYNADLAMSHSDDYDGADFQPNYGNLLPPAPTGADSIPSAKVIFEAEHLHSYGAPLAYFLTGDEALRESYVDFGEFLHHSYYANDLYFDRSIAWMVFVLTDLYRFTGDTTHRDYAWQILETLILPAAQAGSNPGTDYRRGFFVAGVLPGERLTAGFVHGNIVPRAYAYFLAHGDPAHDQGDSVRGALEGLVRYVASEHWWEFGPDQDDYGFSYYQDVDQTPPDPRTDPLNWQQGWRETWMTSYWGYVLTGDPEFLRQGDLMQAKLQQYDTAEFHDWPDRQTLEHLTLAPDEHPRWQDLPLTVDDLGGGTSRLTWVVPPGARRFWLRHADRTIVPWLGFDRETRLFALDPLTNIPFFAAADISDEPPPAAPGSTQSHVVAGLPAGTVFAARVEIDPQQANSLIFTDGFESGDLTAWSGSAP